MIIKVEPTNFFMHSVKLYYNLESPDPEDQPIRDYLAEHELEPRHQSTGDYEGHHSELMQFGGCYMGRHLQHIGAIQMRAVESEIIAVEIEKHLTAAAIDPLPVNGERRLHAVARLVEEFHRESSFQTNENGEAVIVLDGKEVEEAARRVATEALSA